jgi:Rrf2 family protein
MISARREYACRALLELALHWPRPEPLQIHSISERQDIPIRYLVHILIQLKRAGLVASIRGKEGGYNLVKSPNRIKLGEVIREMGGPLMPVAGKNGKKDSIFINVWTEAGDALAQVLDKTSLEDIANKVKGKERAIIYQI